MPASWIPSGANPRLYAPCTRARVSHYYLPVYAWIRGQLQQHREEGEDGPLVVGISAPQGCGKSTLCEELHAAFEAHGLRAVGVSIDDFYLTHTELQRVSGEHPGNRLLEKRGNALTHDLELGTATLRALSCAGGRDARVRVPRYDKSAHAGRGDRFPEDQWGKVEGPVDLVLFEGWMLGFEATDEESAAAVDPDLVPINRALCRYKAAWDKYVHSWIVIRVADPGYAAAWRLEAEQKQRKSGKPAMTDAQVADFVSCYMPAYRLYLPGLYRDGPTTAREGHTLAIEIDRSRVPITDLSSLLPAA